MDFFQGVVETYLRADRALFLNSQFCLQINDAPNPDRSGLHWYVDVVAIDFRSKQIFLCEISYSKGLSDLFKRLMAWRKHWPEVRIALSRDAFLPGFDVRPWVFIPEREIGRFVKRFPPSDFIDQQMPCPRLTNLEAVVPWGYRSWNRLGEPEKSTLVPEAMRF